MSQPSWLDGTPEVYKYQKLGTAYDATTYSTVFDESRYLVANNSAELQSHVAMAKSDSTINAIYLNPAAGQFSYPRNLLGGINRTPDNPLVIRTLPGSAQQASLAAGQEDQYFQGVALVDLDLRNGLVVHGGGQDILIERCVGRFDLQGKRSNGAPSTPITNLQFRLNLVADAWTPSASSMVHGLFVYNVNGLLIEGNIIDHNGWNPAGNLRHAAGPRGCDSSESQRLRRASR